MSGNQYGPKTIKLIGRKHFEISLILQEDGTYTVESIMNNFRGSLGPFVDFKLANAAFEQELIELEGH